MCIRDRDGSGIGEGRMRDTVLLRSVHRKAIQRAMTSGSGAVSYTHLRAHETVLDLVCRLLLEKKTKKNTQTAR